MASAAEHGRATKLQDDLTSALFEELSPFVGEVDASVGAVEASQAALSTRIEAVIEGAPACFARPYRSPDV